MYNVRIQQGVAWRLPNGSANQLRTEMPGPAPTNVPQRAHGAQRPDGVRHIRQFVSCICGLGSAVGDASRLPSLVPLQVTWQLCRRVFDMHHSPMLRARSGR